MLQLNSKERGKENVCRELELKKANPGGYRGREKGLGKTSSIGYYPCFYGPQGHIQPLSQDFYLR